IAERHQARVLGSFRRFAHVLGDGRLRDRVLDEREHPAGHEPGRAYRRAGTGHLGHDDHAPADADVDAPARLGGCHLVGPATVAGVDDDLDAVTPHAVSVPLIRQHRASLCCWLYPDARTITPAAGVAR